MLYGFFSNVPPATAICAFPTVKDRVGFPLTSRKFAYSPHLEKFPPVDSPPPNF